MNGDYVTKQDLADALAEALATQSEELKEFMRQIETNLLTAFRGYAKG